MGSSDTVIAAEGLTKHFGDIEAVNDVSFEVGEGEFFSLLGPSGCGKTTTLRLIAGFEKPTEGNIRIRGDVVNRQPPYKRDVGLVFQGYALFPHKTVGQNVGFGLKMQNVPMEERQTRVAEALEQVDLPGMEDRMPGQLSGGQQQRVALARALVIEPSVLLLDEPLSDLDLKLRKRMRFELQRIQDEVDITTIYVTHDQEEALSMSDRICVMNDGSVEQIAPPDELYDDPKNRFVADFIGDTNLIDGTVSSIDEDRVVVSLDVNEGEYLVDRSLVTDDNLSVGDHVSLNVRPESIKIGDNGEAENSIEGVVQSMTFLGKSRKYLVDVMGLEVLVDEMGGGRTGYDTGEEVTLNWSSQECQIVRNE